VVVLVECGELWMWMWWWWWCGGGGGHLGMYGRLVVVQASLLAGAGCWDQQ